MAVRTVAVRTVAVRNMAVPHEQVAQPVTPACVVMVVVATVPASAHRVPSPAVAPKCSRITRTSAGRPLRSAARSAPVIIPTHFS